MRFAKYLALFLSFALIATTSATGASLPSLITGAKVKNSSLTGADVKNGTITAKDLKPGTIVTAINGSNGKDGISGVNGRDGANGTNGVNGTSAILTVQRVTIPTPIQPGRSTNSVACPAGTQAVAGGYEGDGTGVTITGMLIQANQVLFQMAAAEASTMPLTAVCA